MHHTAMVDRNDLSAPTCNDCHGNHGAAPPGVDAIANVCGTCHTRVRDEVRVEHAQPDLRSRLRRVPQQPRYRAAERRDAGDRQGRALRRRATPRATTATRPRRRCAAGIDTLKAAIAHSEEQIARVENAGIEMGDPALMLREANNHLTLARTEMHAFDPEAGGRGARRRDGADNESGRIGAGGAARGVLPAHGPRRVAGIHRPGGDRAPDEDQNPGVEDVGFRFQALDFRQNLDPSY